MSYTVAAFYQFVPLQQLSDRQACLQELCKQENLIGTILLAEEGINATVAGTEKGIEHLIKSLHADPCFREMVVKYSVCEEPPFRRMKVLIKKEIVTFGVADLRPDQMTGIQVSPDEWNVLLQQDDVIVIDTRNTYEIEQGTFKGAIDPKTEKFTDFIDYVKTKLNPDQHKKIAMCCTGGIRCEKASAYLLRQGFEQIYQLEGGILRYLEDVDPNKSLWEGQCFIFDARETVKSESLGKPHSKNTPCVS